MAAAEEAARLEEERLRVEEEVRVSHCIATVLRGPPPLA